MDRVLDIDETKRMSNLSDSGLRREELRGSFPRRRRISPNRVGWLESEVLAWVKRLPPVDGDGGSGCPGSLSSP